MNDAGKPNPSHERRVALEVTVIGSSDSKDHPT